MVKMNGEKSQGQEKKMVKIKGVCHMLKLSMNKWNHRGFVDDNNKGMTPEQIPRNENRNHCSWERIGDKYTYIHN